MYKPYRTKVVLHFCSWQLFCTDTAKGVMVTLKRSHYFPLKWNDLREKSSKLWNNWKILQNNKEDMGNTNITHIWKDRWAGAPQTRYPKREQGGHLLWGRGDKRFWIAYKNFLLKIGSKDNFQCFQAISIQLFQQFPAIFDEKIMKIGIFSDSRQ